MTRATLEHLAAPVESRMDREARRYRMRSLEIRATRAAKRDRAAMRAAR